MSKKTRIDQLISRNPKADPEKVKKGLRYIENLDDHGVTDQSYNISPPFSRRQKKVQQRNRLAAIS